MLITTNYTAGSPTFLSIYIQCYSQQKFAYAGFTYISSEMPKVVLEIFYDQYVNHNVNVVRVSCLGTMVACMLVCFCIKLWSVEWNLIIIITMLSSQPVH